jgi:hypothetical protein
MRPGAYKAILALSGIFVAGILTGSVAGVAWARQQQARLLSEHEVAERQLQRLEASLELTAQQVECMRPVMKDFAERVRIARRNAFADVGEVWREINAQLERELKPKQLKKFREIQAADLARWEHEKDKRCPKPKHSDTSPESAADILQLAP